jgi:hypothetical protein
LVKGLRRGISRKKAIGLLAVEVEHHQYRGWKMEEWNNWKNWIWRTKLLLVGGDLFEFEDECGSGDFVSTSC